MVHRCAAPSSCLRNSVAPRANYELVDVGSGGELGNQMLILAKTAARHHQERWCVALGTIGCAREALDVVDRVSQRGCPGMRVTYSRCNRVPSREHALRLHIATPLPRISGTYDALLQRISNALGSAPDSKYLSLETWDGLGKSRYASQLRTCCDNSSSLHNHNMDRGSTKRAHVIPETCSIEPRA